MALCSGSFFGFSCGPWHTLLIWALSLFKQATLTLEGLPGIIDFGSRLSDWIILIKGFFCPDKDIRVLILLILDNGKCFELEVISGSYMSCSASTKCDLTIEDSSGSAKTCGIYLCGTIALLNYPKKLWEWIHSDNLQESVLFKWVLGSELRWLSVASTLYPLRNVTSPINYPFFFYAHLYIYLVCTCMSVCMQAGRWMHTPGKTEVRGQLLEVVFFLPLSRSQGLKWVSLGVVISSFLPLSYPTCH